MVAMSAALVLLLCISGFIWGFREEGKGRHLNDGGVAMTISFFVGIVAAASLMIALLEGGE